MIALRKVSLENYRSLRQVSVPLGALNVLVGPNGAGKSNFLDVLQFLGDIARSDLQPAIDERGGFDALLFRGRVLPKPSTIRISIEATITGYASQRAPDEYSLRFRQHRGMLLTRFEDFTFKRTQGRGRRINVSGSKVEVYDKDQSPTLTRPMSSSSAALSTLPRLGREEGAEQVRALAELFKTLRVFNIDVEAARSPSAISPAPTLSSDASNLAPFLRWLSETSPETFELVQQDLGFIFPGLARIRFVPFGGSFQAVAIELEEASLSRALPLGLASFGTVRALALLAMLHDPHPPTLSCVEEIDHGLHPHALDRIVERLREASQRTQILVATHSPTLVNRLQPEELIVCERDPETGESRIPAIESSVVREMSEESKLLPGELWFTGALGGALP
jgi:predicted ATPase